MVDIRPVRKEDYESIAKELYENIRFADQLEMVQLHRNSWQYVLDSMLSSDILYQARDEAGRLLCLTGTAPIDGDLYSCVWCPWDEGVKPSQAGFRSLWEGFNERVLGLSARIEKLYRH